MATKNQSRILGVSAKETNPSIQCYNASMQTIVRDLDLTEILNGEEVMGPSPFFKHQRIVFDLAYMVRHHIDKYRLGQLHISPLDVIFEEGINRLQPDILFIKKDNISIAQDWIRGVPDMVCETVSVGTFERDTEVKMSIYEKYKVPEYWIVLPELLTFEIFTIENDKYKLHSVAELEGTVTSKVIEGLQVDIKTIFEQ